MDLIGQSPESVSGLRIGKYKIVRRLAVGGMGEVFLARHEGPAGFSKTLVVKRILAHLASELQFVEMFLNEARLAAMVSHPNVVQIFELGEDEGSYFMAMEYIQGRSVRAIETKLQRSGRMFDPSLAAYLAAHALQGLHHAHEMRDDRGEPFQIVHRDVSPDNILIGYGGVVKLLDFGIAKAVAAAANQTGTLRGKFAYMSFEQLTGSPLDRRADIYSMGSVLYEMVTGQLPYVGAHPAFIASMMRTRPVAPSLHNPKVPLELDSILFKALAMEADKRFQTAEEMGDALMEFASRREKLTSIQVDSFLRRAFDEDSAPEEMIADQAGTQVVSPGTGQGITSPGSGAEIEISKDSSGSLPAAEPLGPETEPKTLAPVLDETRTAAPVLDETRTAAPVLLDETRPMRPLSELPTSLLGVPGIRPARSKTAEKLRALHSRFPRTGILGRRQLKRIAAGLAVVLVVLVPILVARLLRNRLVVSSPRPVSSVAQVTPPPAAADSAKPSSAAADSSKPPRSARPVTPPLIVVDVNTPEAPEEAAATPGRNREKAQRATQGEAKHFSARSRDSGGSSNRGGEPETKVATARPAARPREPEIAAPKPTNRPGAVAVRVHPWAEVLVAGRNLGTTPLPAFSLPAGRHVIVLRNPELGVEKSVTVTVPSGGETSVSVNLMQVAKE
ncbi:MAG: protein kinase domain-containing protein [Myxococcaceae bacterium]